MPDSLHHLNQHKTSAIGGRGLRVAVILAFTLLLHALAMVAARDRIDVTESDHPPPTTISIALLHPEAPPPAPPPAPKPRPVVRTSQPLPTTQISASQVSPSAPEPAPAPVATVPEPVLPEPVPDLPVAPAPAPTTQAPDMPPVPPADIGPQVPPLLITAQSAPQTGRLVYRLTHSRFSGITGRTVLDWKVDPASSQYEIRLRAGALGFEVEMRSSGELGPSGLLPRHYQQGKRTVDFDWAQARAKMSDNAELAALVEGTQDMLSFQFQLPLLAQAYPWRFNPGSVVEIPVVRPNALEMYEFAVDGFEVVRTGAGDMQALKLRRAKTAEHDGIELWLAPELQWLPVRLRVDDKRNEVWDNLLIDTPSPADIEREERRAANVRAGERIP